MIKLLFVLAEKAQKKADPRLKLQESIYELSRESIAKKKAEELVEKQRIQYAKRAEREKRQARKAAKKENK